MANLNPAKVDWVVAKDLSAKKVKDDGKNNYLCQDRELAQQQYICTLITYISV
jgi:hypothetical protein